MSWKVRRVGQSWGWYFGKLDILRVSVTPSKTCHWYDITVRVGRWSGKNALTINLPCAIWIYLPLLTAAGVAVSWAAVSVSACAIHCYVSVSLPLKFIISCFYQLIDFIANFRHLGTSRTSTCLLVRVILLYCFYSSISQGLFFCLQSTKNWYYLSIQRYFTNLSNEDIHKNSTRILRTSR